MIEFLIYIIETILSSVKIAPPVAEWIINFIQKMYLMVNKNYRTIDQHENELNDDILALFLVSILRLVFLFEIHNERVVVCLIDSI
jgi:hypothetical protein